MSVPHQANQTVHSFLTTPLVHHGAGAVSKLPEVLRQLGSTRPAIVTDPGLLKAGIVGEVSAILNAPPVFSAVEPEPSDELVATCTAFLRENKADAVIGLGGGSAIDVAKLAAALVNNPGSVEDYYGLEKVPNRGVPFIAIPTTAGTGSEATPAAVFRNVATGTKKGVRSAVLQPAAAILDPLLTLSLPPAVTAATGVDALTHAIEAYTSRAATVLNRFFAENAVTLIARHLHGAYTDGRSVEHRDGMLMGSYIAGLSFAIANVGAVHAIAQALGGLYAIPHGIANAVMLPHVMEFNRSACAADYARIGQLMGVVDPAAPIRTDAQMADQASRATITAVRDLAASVGIPLSLRAFNVAADQLEFIATRCVESQARLLVLNVREATHADIVEILRHAYGS